MREMDRIEVLRILKAMSETEWMTIGEISAATANGVRALHKHTIARYLNGTAALYVESRGKTMFSARGRKILVNQWRRKPGMLEQLKGTL